MADGLSLAASVVAVAEVGFSCAQALYKFSKGLAEQNESLERLQDHVQSTSNVLKHVSRLLDNERHQPNRELRQDIRQAARSSERVFEAIFKMLSDGDPRSQRGVRRIVRKMRYSAFVEAEVKKYRVELQETQMTLSLMLHVHWQASSADPRAAIVEMLKNGLNRAAEARVPAVAEAVAEILKGMAISDAMGSEQDSGNSRGGMSKISTSRGFMSAASSTTFANSSIRVPSDMNDSGALSSAISSSLPRSTRPDLDSIPPPPTIPSPERIMWTAEWQESQLTCEQQPFSDKIIDKFVQEHVDRLMSALRELDPALARAIKKHAVQRNEVLLAIYAHIGASTTTGVEKVSEIDFVTESKTSQVDDDFLGKRRWRTKSETIADLSASDRLKKKLEEGHYTFDDPRKFRRSEPGITAKYPASNRLQKKLKETKLTKPLRRAGGHESLEGTGTLHMEAPEARIYPVTGPAPLPPDDDNDETQAEARRRKERETQWRREHEQAERMNSVPTAREASHSSDMMDEWMASRKMKPPGRLPPPPTDRESEGDSGSEENSVTFIDSSNPIVDRKARSNEVAVKKWVTKRQHANAHNQASDAELSDDDDDDDNMAPFKISGLDIGPHPTLNRSSLKPWNSPPTSDRTPPGVHFDDEDEDVRAEESHKNKCKEQGQREHEDDHRCSPPIHTETDEEPDLAPEQTRKRNAQAAAMASPMRQISMPQFSIHGSASPSSAEGRGNSFRLDESDDDSEGWYDDASHLDTHRITDLPHFPQFRGPPSPQSLNARVISRRAGTVRGRRSPRNQGPFQDTIVDDERSRLSNDSGVDGEDDDEDDEDDEDDNGIAATDSEPTIETEIKPRVSSDDCMLKRAAEGGLFKRYRKRIGGEPSLTAMIGGAVPRRDPVVPINVEEDRLEQAAEELIRRLQERWNRADGGLESSMPVLREVQALYE